MDVGSDSQVRDMAVVRHKCYVRHLRLVSGEGLLNHLPLPTLVLTDAQGLLNHSVFIHTTFWDNEQRPTYIYKLC